MKRCPNCGRLELLAAHTDCHGSARSISFYPNPYSASTTIIRGGHTPPQGIRPTFELPLQLPMLLRATMALWRVGLLSVFSMLLVPFTVALTALVLPVLVDHRLSTQLGLAGLLFLPLWIAAEGASLVRLSEPASGEGRITRSLRSWNTALRQVPRLAWFHGQLLLLMALYAAPFALMGWIWPEATIPAVALGLLASAWPWARHALVLPLLLLEGHSVSIALKRSREATAGYMWMLWRLFSVLLLTLFGGVFLVGRGVVVACEFMEVDGLPLGLLLLGVVVFLPPLLYVPLIAARLVVNVALPRVRFATPPAVLAVFSEREAAEALAHRLAGKGVAAEVVGGTDIGSLRLLVTDAQVIVAEEDLPKLKFSTQEEK
ncbi:MAG: hypothetical protein MUC50_05380 [Myxococcota bacterium]|jgi:hypothetical protein|nr:hypothetical protein [Myxococcota bacterium]